MDGSQEFNLVVVMHPNSARVERGERRDVGSEGAVRRRGRKCAVGRGEKWGGEREGEDAPRSPS